MASTWPSFNNLLDSAHLAGFKAHLDPVRVMSGTGQYFLHNPARLLPGSLVLFLDDVDFKSGFYIFSVLTVHTHLAFRFGITGAKPGVRHRQSRNVDGTRGQQRDDQQRKQRLKHHQDFRPSGQHRRVGRRKRRAGVEGEKQIVNSSACRSARMLAAWGFANTCSTFRSSITFATAVRWKTGCWNMRIICTNISCR